MNRVSQTDRISNKNQVHSYRLSSVIIMMDSDIGVKKTAYLTYNEREEEVVPQIRMSVKCMLKV